MIDHDDARFNAFTRDLARRHRRPRSYPPSPARPDVLEQLCGGIGQVPPPPLSLSEWPDTMYPLDLVDDDESSPGPIDLASN